MSGQGKVWVRVEMVNRVHTKINGDQLVEAAWGSEVLRKPWVGWLGASTGVEW